MYTRTVVLYTDNKCTVVLYTENKSTAVLYTGNKSTLVLYTGIKSTVVLYTNNNKRTVVSYTGNKSTVVSYTNNNKRTVVIYTDNKSTVLSYTENKNTVVLYTGNTNTEQKLFLWYDWLVEFWCFNATFSNISAYIMATSFSGGSRRSTRREPSITGKQLVNFITCAASRVHTFCNLQRRARTHAVLVICLY